MNSNRINNLTLKQFNYRLEREGKVFYNAYSKEAYNVLLRKAGSLVVSQEKLTLYYLASENINKGDILKYKSEYYLVMNKNRGESELFYYSSCIRCNDVWNVKGTPVYVISSTLSSVNPVGSSMVSVIGGKFSVKTSDIDFLHNHFSIDEEIYAMGGVYKLTNKAFCDGFAQLHFSRDSWNPVKDFEIVYAGKSNFSVGEEYELNAYLKRDSLYITDAVMKYEVEENDIASIEDNTITFKKKGSVVVKVTSTGYCENGKEVYPYNVTTTFTLGCNTGNATNDGTESGNTGGTESGGNGGTESGGNNQGDIDNVIYSAVISGSDEIKSMKRTWTAIFYKDGVEVPYEEVPAVTWGNDALTTDLIMTDNKNGKVGLKIENYYDNIGVEFNIFLYINGNLVASKNIMVVSM